MLRLKALAITAWLNFFFLNLEWGTYEGQKMTHGNSRDQTQVVKFGGKCLYLVIQLAGPTLVLVFVSLFCFIFSH